MDHSKTTRNTNCTNSSCKGHYTVRVSGIIYHWAIFFQKTDALGLVTVTVIGQRFDCQLCNHVIPALQQRGYVDWIIFMQDDALPLIPNTARQLLKWHFGDAKIIISRHFLTAKPYRSPGHNAYDFRLWSYLKDVVLITLNTVELKAAINYGTCSFSILTPCKRRRKHKEHVFHQSREN